ncbi:hypothetical protein Back2_08660 [Nocardioides baekrokdamisoli]|uniref:G domain-containing protein n=1 Tax=Nocardioides baekrokdamisoli TaxID=1804624 RepID=A0A3G9J0U4_9ACTN|nr:GTPase [Nocardioides baekrokdamisoli]BBH16579.1 hypothetical protein Back2_08660 [Nocardioides baekrokdamisoli]
MTFETPLRDSLVDRLEALSAATDAGRGRVPDALIDEAAALTERSLARRKLSSGHTVVAIAGATGSGKSSTFNALTGLELSAVGVRRPTTSWATACVWGAEGASELLNFLGIPDRHQTTRDSMLDTRRESNELDGVVLLDLPDHDSTEVAHHLEVDRLVGHADLTVWVVDPQKYADAAIHDRYLEPFQTHSATMLVVLNHIDEVPEERRESMVADLHRLLVIDGLADVPIFAVSARLGWGIPELRAEIVRRVASKTAAGARSEADLRAITQKLAGKGATSAAVTSESVATLVDGLTAAVGTAGLSESIAAAVSRRTAVATAWPLLAWRRVGRAYSPALQPADRSAVDLALRGFADSVGHDLDKPWRQSIRRVSVDRVDAVGDAIDSALGARGLARGKVPGWARGVQLLQWLLVLALFGGLGWAAYLHWGPKGQSMSVVVPLIAAVGGLVGGVLLALMSLMPTRRAGANAAEQLAAGVRASVAEVAETEVVAPVRGEVAAHTAFHAALRRTRE